MALIDISSISDQDLNSQGIDKQTLCVSINGELLFIPVKEESKIEKALKTFYENSVKN